MATASAPQGTELGTVVAQTVADSGPEQQTLDLRRLSQQLDAVARGGRTATEAVARLVSHARQMTPALAAVYFARGTGGDLLANPLCSDPESLTEGTLQQMFVLALRADEQAAVQIAQSRGEDQRVAIAVPVFIPERPREVLLAVYADDGRDIGNLSGRVQLLELLAAQIANWRIDREGRPNETLVQLLATMAQSERMGQFSASAARIADHLASRAVARLAAVGVRRAGSLSRLVGLSHQLQMERGAPLVAHLEAVLSESLDGEDRGNQACSPAPLRESDAVRLLKQSAQVEHVYRWPFTDGEGEVFGAGLVLCDEPLNDLDLAQLRADCQLLGPHLAALRLRRTPWRDRWRQSLKKLSPRNQRLLAVASCLTLAASVLVPLPYRVSCDCEIQPAERRFVTIPYEGRLEAALVRPGDEVQAGQVLARMDDTELHKEMLALESELASWYARQDEAQVNRDVATKQIAGHEIAFRERRLEILRDRREHLEIRSPLAGVVISGDPTKLEDARMTIGQTLVEVGPLNDLIVEVAVADEDVDRVLPGQSATFRLDALPLRSFRGELVRIHPRSEQRDGQNVFVAELRLAEESSSLRPGMRGRAKLAAGNRPLIWILFHRALEQLVFRMGW